MRKIILLTAIMAAYTCASFAQGTPDTITATNIFKASNAIKTDQTNEILTSFYQLSLKDIFGKSPQVAYMGTLFGLFDSVKKKNNWGVDTMYKKTRWLRRAQYSASAKVDSNYRLTSYGIGGSYAILNFRDITSIHVRSLDYLTGLDTNYNKLISKVVGIVTHGLANSAHQQKLKDLNASIEKFKKSGSNTDLDPSLLHVLDSLNAYKDFRIGVIGRDSLYNAITKLIRERPLLTVGYMNNNNLIKSGLDTSTYKLDFLVGFYHHKKSGGLSAKPWEISADAYMKTFQAAPAATTNKEVYAELGVNKILRVDSAGNSLTEFKLAASYDNLYGTSAFKETYTFNATLRFNVYKNFWIPLTLKYDPNTGNIFGFLSLTANIDKASSGS